MLTDIIKTINKIFKKKDILGFEFVGGAKSSALKSPEKASCPANVTVIKKYKPITCTPPYASTSGIQDKTETAKSSVNNGKKGPNRMIRVCPMHFGPETERTLKNLAKQYPDFYDMFVDEARRTMDSNIKKVSEALEVDLKNHIGNLLLA